MLRVGRSLFSLGNQRSLSLSAAEVRSSFIRFFEKLDHVHVPSSSVLLNAEDQSLLFVNAGMNQFKSIFLDTLDPSSPVANIKRAVNSQRCLRVGGKHNDLADVGKDDYHHTFFEMLGNWSFGDYYKAEACEYAWNYLTEVLHLEPARLYVSYFGGDKAMNLEPDFECRDIWLKLGIPEDHIVSSDAKNNFWTMGETGPCGPCSEIHYDRRQGRGNVAHLVNQDDPEVIELWNIVFMQFERKGDEAINPLHKKHIDCGMGFERLVSVVQNKKSSYDTDLFMPVMDVIQKNGNVGKPYTGLIGPLDTSRMDSAYRIVADHLRGSLIALSDGVKPKGVDQGFVIRKMLRRAAQQSVDVLKTDRHSLSSVIPFFCQHLESVYPGIESKTKYLTNLIAQEEKKYWKLKDDGTKSFEKFADAVRSGNVFPAPDAFWLHNTMGFTIDMTMQMAEERGMTLNLDEFRRLQIEAANLTKSAQKLQGGRMKSGKA